MTSEFNQKKQIAEWKGYPIILDWTYVLREHGNRKIVEGTEKVLGRFLFFVSLTLFVAVLVLKLMIGEYLFFLNHPTSMLDIIFWGSQAVLLYSAYLTRDLEKFSDTLSLRSLSELRRELKEKKKNEIDVVYYFDHDLLDVIDRIAVDRPLGYLKRLVFDLAKYPQVENIILRLGLTPQKILNLDFNKIDIPLSDFESFMEKLILESFSLSLLNDFDYVDERAMFIALMQGSLKQLLLEVEVNEEEINGIILWIKNQEKKKEYFNLWKYRASLKPTSVVNRSYTSGFAGTLNKFSRDFTVEVIKGDFTLSIAREKELGELTDLLTQGEGESILIVGEPGVGKTTLLKSLALKMVVEDVPDVIKDMRLVAFDISKASAISRNLDSFKTKIEKIFEDTAKAKNIILVLEDISQILALRDDFADEIVSIIIEGIDRYKLRLIVTATNQDYVKFIKPRTGLIKFFNLVKMEAPSAQTTQQILLDELPHMEFHYKTKVSFDAIKSIVDLSNEAIPDKSQPQKSLDILEEALARGSKKKDGIVTQGDIEALISEKVGAKVGQITKNEEELLSNLETELHKKVIGQDTAVSAVAAALRRSRAGLSGTNRPIASFLFFGPTGVGKTETAKTIASVYYGDENLMIRLDMSEYQESENLDRLVGYFEDEKFEGGFLTEPVREHPFSLILLDEIEKANPKVLDLFLQVLDEGFVTDGLGRKVNFTNTIIIATSNASSKVIAEELEHGKTYDQVYESVMPKLRENFRVEFLNRFDKIVMYKPLEKKEIVQVANILMKKEVEKLKTKGISLTYSPQLLIELAELGYDPVYGARELRRVVQDHVEDPLSQLIIKKVLKSGGKYHIENLSQFKKA